MKYIKKYEVNKKDKTKLDKYLIITSTDLDSNNPINTYYILEVLNYNKNNMKVVKLYTYENGEFIKYSNDAEKPKTFHLRFNNSLLEIIYDSNDLEDIFNMVEVLDKSNKYNL